MSGISALPPSPGRPASPSDRRAGHEIGDSKPPRSRADVGAAAIVKANGAAQAFAADVADSVQCEAQVAETNRRFARIDIAINIAGPSTTLASACTSWRSTPASRFGSA